MTTTSTVLLIALTTLAAVVGISRAGSYERAKRQLGLGGLIPREFQNINFENYLKNPRAVQFQLRCVIYDGPCDRIGKYLKANVPNWLATQCKNCNAAQRRQAAKAIMFFQTNYPKEWNDAVRKYRGSFSAEDIRRFESELGIHVVANVPQNQVYRNPDTAGLVALARESIAVAKTTPEPLILQARSLETETHPAVAAAAPEAAGPVVDHRNAVGKESLASSSSPSNVTTTLE